MRIDMIDDGRGRAAAGAGGMLREEFPAGLTPSRRAIQRERYAIPLLRIVPIARGLASPADGTVDRRLPGHDGAFRNDKASRASLYAFSVDSRSSDARLSRAPQKVASKAVFCLACRCLTDIVSLRRISLTAASRLQCHVDPRLLPTRYIAGNRPDVPEAAISRATRSPHRQARVASAAPRGRASLRS